MSLSDDERRRIEEEMRGASVRGRAPVPPAETGPRPGDGLRAPALSGYLAETMAPGERLLYTTRRHWATVAPAPAIPLVLALVCLPSIWALSLFFFIPLAVVGGIAAYVSYASAEFGLTDRRVLAKTGWLHRRSSEVLLSKIESIVVDQGMVGRLLGYGTVVIIGTGGSREAPSGIEDPLEFRRHVQAQLASAQ